MTVFTGQQQDRPSGDPELRPFLEAASEADASAALEQLLSANVARVIRDAVRREIGTSMAGAGHAEDVLSDVRARLVSKLWRLRQDGPETDGIANLAAYAAVVAEHACYAFLRAQFPERTRLRNRVRYAAGHHPSLTLTRDPGGLWQCASRGPSLAVAGSAQRFLDDPRGWVAAHRVDAGAPLPALLAAVLSRVDRPIALDRLVDGLALLLGIADSPPPGRSETDDAQDVVDPAPSAAVVLEQRESLIRVWEEIVALPPRQRAALLLNLRDPQGSAVLPLLVDTGVVSMAGLADAAGLSSGEFAGLWDQLPIDDLTVAARLGITRQQVINLRKAARARLARRLVIRRPSSRRHSQVEPL
jgi:DNA-directed RNA polymerase specialized sigma24 family protein